MMKYNCYKKNIKKENFQGVKINQSGTSVDISDKSYAGKDVAVKIDQTTVKMDPTVVQASAVVAVQAQQQYNNPLQNFQLPQFPSELIDKYNKTCPVQVKNDFTSYRGPQLIKYLANLFIGKMPVSFEDIIDNGTLNLTNDDINYILDFIQQIIELIDDCINDIKEEFNYQINEELKKGKKVEEYTSLGLLGDSIINSINNTIISI